MKAQSRKLVSKCATSAFIWKSSNISIIFPFFRTASLLLSMRHFSLRKASPFGKLSCSTCAAERFVYIVLTGALVCVCLNRNASPRLPLPSTRTIGMCEMMNESENSVRVWNWWKRPRRNNAYRGELWTQCSLSFRAVWTRFAVRFRSRRWWFVVT